MTVQGHTKLHSSIRKWGARVIKPQKDTREDLWARLLISSILKTDLTQRHLRPCQWEFAWITLAKDVSLRCCLVWDLMRYCPAHGGWYQYGHELLVVYGTYLSKSQGASHLSTFFHSFCFKPLPWLPSVMDPTVPCEIDLFSAPNPLKENIASGMVFRLTTLNLCSIKVCSLCVFLNRIFCYMTFCLVWHGCIGMIVLQAQSKPWGDNVGFTTVPLSRAYHIVRISSTLTIREKQLIYLLLGSVSMTAIFSVFCSNRKVHRLLSHVLRKKLGPSNDMETI